MGVFALPPQDPIQKRPALPGLPNIGNDCRSVVFNCGKEASHKLKQQHCFQWPIINPERYHYPRLILLFCHPPSLPLHYPCTEERRRVAEVQRCQLYKQITVQEEGTGVVPFLKDTYRVSHVLVHEVYTEVGAR